MQRKALCRWGAYEGSDDQTAEGKGSFVCILRVIRPKTNGRRRWVYQGHTTKGGLWHGRNQGGRPRSKQGSG